MRRARAFGIGLCLSAAACTGGRADSRPAADAPRRVQVVKAEKRLIPRTVGGLDLTEIRTALDALPTLSLIHI